MLLKAAVLLPWHWFSKIKNGDRWLFTRRLGASRWIWIRTIKLLAQNHVLPADIVQTLSLVVALSMFLTPGLFILFDKVILPRYEQKSDDREEDTIERHSNHIAGIGRFRSVNRLLVSNDVKTVVLDHQANQVDVLRSINIKSYFGDATRQICCTLRVSKNGNACCCHRQSRLKRRVGQVR